MNAFLLNDNEFLRIRKTQREIIEVIYNYTGSDRSKYCYVLRSFSVHEFERIVTTYPIWLFMSNFLLTARNEVKK